MYALWLEVEVDRAIGATKVVKNPGGDVHIHAQDLEVLKDTAAAVMVAIPNTVVVVQIVIVTVPDEAIEIATVMADQVQIQIHPEVPVRNVKKFEAFH